MGQIDYPKQIKPKRVVFGIQRQNEVSSKKTTDLELELDELKTNNNRIDAENEQRDEEIDKKQDTLQFDNVPTQNSVKPVKSGGIYNALSQKQDILQFDDTPTENSQKLLKSGKIFDALSTKQNTITAGTGITIQNDTVAVDTTTVATKTDLAGKQDALTLDNTPTRYSDNAVKSGGVFDALAFKQDVLIIDTTPKQNSTNPITSGGVYSALQNVGGNITIDSTPTQNSQNAVSSGGVYSALQNKQDTLTAGTNISINNGVISSTGGSGGLSSVSASDVDSGNATSGQVLMADGNGGASWQTVSGGMTQEQQTMLTNAYNYFLTHVVEPDPAYNPQTYNEYPAGTVFQNYAKFSQRCNLTFTTTLTSPNMVFSAIDNSTGILNIQLTFTCSSNFNGTIDVYQNDTSIYHEQYNFNDSSLSYVFERTINGVNLADGNVFFVQIESTTSTSFILTKYESYLVAPNAEVINQISPFNVEYFDGKYYISDCSSGTAKIAEIDVQDLFNLNSLTWVDTGINCLQYKTSFNMKQYGNDWIADERFDYYLNLDNTYTFLRKSNETSITYSQALKLDWTPSTSDYLKFAMHDKNSGGLDYFEYSSSNTNLYTRNNDQLYNLCAVKYLVDITSSSTRAYSLISRANGHIYPYMIHANSIYTIDLGFGKNQHCYFDNPTSRVAPMICYYNQYGKIIKKEFNYTASLRAYTITNTEEIGYYDEYFEGVNNDYFVVQNNTLHYHKKTT